MLKSTGLFALIVFGSVCSSAYALTNTPHEVIGCNQLGGLTFLAVGITTLTTAPNVVEFEIENTNLDHAFATLAPTSWQGPTPAITGLKVSPIRRKGPTTDVFTVSFDIAPPTDPNQNGSFIFSVSYTLFLVDKPSGCKVTQPH